MRVGDIMSTRIVTVELDDELRVVKEIFDAKRFHHLLVIDAGKIVGVVSDRDLLRALSPFIGTIAETTRDARTLDKRVHQIMTRALITVAPEASLSEAVEAFLEHGISCLPVIAEHQRPVGILTWRDLLRALRPA